MDRLRSRLAEQAGVIHRRQALAQGWSSGEIRQQVRRGSWRAIYPGVYATFTGPPTFAARVWAALQHAGPPAIASHQTAAHLQGLLDDEPRQIQISVPNDHRVTPQPALRVHRPRAWAERSQSAASIPQTRIEDTVLDLIAQTRDPQEVVQWILRACQRRLTTPARLRAAAGRRRRLRHRALLHELTGEVEAGVASPLERRYRTNVELAHELPDADRGLPWIGPDGVRRYFDARYRVWRVRVELEGLAFHPADRSRVDHSRDNAAVLEGDVVLRYGWAAVTNSPCQVAAQVAAVLTLRGWPGPVKPCGPGCPAAWTGAVSPPAPQ